MKGMIVSILLLLNCLPAAQALEPLVFVTSDYPPYVIEDEGIARGIVPDIIRAGLKDTDIEAVFKFQPWNRGQTTVKNGDAYACFPYLITEQRSEFFDFSAPLIGFFPKFFHSKAKFPQGFSWKELNDFLGYKMGGVRGFWYEPAFEKEGLKVNYVSTDLQNMHMLIKGRIDFTLIDELVGWYLIKNHYPTQLSAFAVADKPESSEALHLMISKDYPNAKALTQVFNEGLRKIKDNGTYQDILERYEIPLVYASVNQD
jgi:polar amino acid transport system substrate-binding protein